MNSKSRLKALLGALGLITVFTLVILAVIYRSHLTPNNFRRLLTYMETRASGETPVSRFVFDGSAKNRVAQLDHGIAVASPDGLRIISAGGIETTYDIYHFTRPAITVSSGLACAYDRGGPRLLAADSKSIKLQKDDLAPIISARMNAEGYLALVTEEDGRKALVAVFNPLMEEVYRFYSSGRYVSLAGVSPDGGYMAAACFTASGGAMESELLIYSVQNEDSENPDGSLKIHDSMIYDFGFLSGESLWVLTGDSLIYIDIDGKVTFRYDFREMELQNWTETHDGGVALLLTRYRGGSQTVLAVIGADGTETARAAQNETVTAMSASRDGIVLLRPEKVTFLNKDLETVLNEPITGDYRDVIAREDGSVLLCGASFVDVITD